MYARHGDPLQALTELNPPAPVLHLYTEPRAPEYLSAQESFAREHSWFAVRRLESVSHFPTIEVPMSNPIRRGPASQTAAVSQSVVAGFGIAGYALALHGIRDMVAAKK